MLGANGNTDKLMLLNTAPNKQTFRYDIFFIKKLANGPGLFGGNTMEISGMCSPKIKIFL